MAQAEIRLSASSLSVEYAVPRVDKAPADGVRRYSRSSILVRLTARLKREAGRCGYGFERVKAVDVPPGETPRKAWLPFRR